VGEDESIRFEFKFHGIKIELSGESQFVDALYRDLMRDIAAARHELETPKTVVKTTHFPTPVWVHQCSEMMRKIYMSNTTEMKGSSLGKALDFEAVRTFYADEAVFNTFFPALANNRTMWAELTDEGQRTIRTLPHGQSKSSTR